MWEICSGNRPQRHQAREFHVWNQEQGLILSFWTHWDVRKPSTSELNSDRKNTWLRFFSKTRPQVHHLYLIDFGLSKKCSSHLRISSQSASQFLSCEVLEVVDVWVQRDVDPRYFDQKHVQLRTQLSLTGTARPSCFKNFQIQQFNK